MPIGFLIGRLLRLGVKSAVRSTERKQDAPPRLGNRPPLASVLDPVAGPRTVGGVALTVGAMAPHPMQPWAFLYVRARARGPRLVRSYDWDAMHVPEQAYPLLQLPRIDDGSTRGDATAATALPALDRTWTPLATYGVRVAIASNGIEVVAWLDEPASTAIVEAAIAQVVAIARWDAPLAADLAALPDAKLIADATLSPAAQLAPDGLRVGVKDGALIAEVAGVSRAVERTRLLAEITELRAQVAGVGPYR